MSGWRAAVPRPLRRAARRLRNRLGGASVILLYHRIAEDTSDPWSLCVSPRRFAEQMEVLRRRHLALDLDALVSGGVRRRGVAVTFDDGYADFATAARPVLERFAIPASLFVVTGGLDDAGEFWWDDLERVALLAPTVPAALEIEVGGARYAWSAGSEGGREALYRDLHARLGGLAGSERERTLAALRRWADLPAAGRPTHRRLGAAALAEIAAGGLVSLGAHTVSHSYLSRLALDEQRREIEDSRRHLEAIAGGPVPHLSFPHGDYSPETLSLVVAAGFRAACTSACAPVFPHTDAYQLPRVEPGNQDGDTFARWLEDWVG